MKYILVYLRRVNVNIKNIFFSVLQLIGCTLYIVQIKLLQKNSTPSLVFYCMYKITINKKSTQLPSIDGAGQCPQ